MKKFLDEYGIEISLYTDWKEKQFKYGYEVPKQVLESDFDHLSEEENFDGFLKYRDSWYHVSDFMRISAQAPEWMKKWNGYLNDSFFSGVVIKISDDMETYKIGTFIA